MFLGACIDLGMPPELLAEAVGSLGIPELSIEARRALRGGVSGVRLRALEKGRALEGPDPEEATSDDRESSGPSWQGDHAATVITGASTRDHDHDHGGRHAHGHHGHRHSSERSEHQHHEHRGLDTIRSLIQASGLASGVRDRAVAMFERLGEVEALIHGVSIHEVHFHEVGALDSIVDIVGAALAIEQFLQPKLVTCGTVVVGSGRVRTEHGVVPVPAPATAALLCGVPIAPGPPGELVTPTGALILDALVDRYVPGPEMVIDNLGYGLGRWDLASQPNVLRLALGHASAAATARVAVLEAQIDDLSGEGFGFLFERLADAGALDVFYTPVQMKKGRPGVLVSVLARPDDREHLAHLLLLESGSLGCRWTMADRLEAERSTQTVETSYGPVTIKLAVLGGREIARAPEFEDCRRLARAAEVPWREVYRAAVVAASEKGVGTP